MPSVVYIEMERAGNGPACYGSGFFVTKTQILTNKHVVTCSGSNRGRVKLVGSERAYPTTTILAWPDLDLALVEAHGLSTSPLELGTGKDLRIGDDIFVVGNPAGLEGTFTRGIVSGVRSREGLLQIDAPVSRGSSGGPVVDAYGRVVGITISSISEGQNLNFAIPASSLVMPLERMRQMMARQKSNRASGRLGVAESRNPTISAPPPTSVDAARRKWESNPDWTIFVSPVVGDSLIKEELKALLDTGLNVNTVDKQGRMVLHLAAALGQAELVRHLLSSGADVNARDREGRTALMLAASLNDIRPSADNSPWERLWTESPCAGMKAERPFPGLTDDLLAWHLRAQAQAPVLRLLLEAGADARLADSNGLTALDHAYEGGPNELDQILRSSQEKGILASSCGLTLEQAPTLKGFRLGMSLRDVLARFRGFELPQADPCGRLTLLFNAQYGTLSQYALRPEEFKGVGQIRLSFVDGRLAFVQMFYDRFPWKSMDEYLAQISSSFRLPGKWRQAAGGSNWVKVHAIGCDGFKVLAGRSSAPFVELHDTASLQILLKRGIDAQVKRHELEQEKQRY